MRDLLGEPLARHGFWRVGGPLERLVFVDTAAELRTLGPVDHVLGNGSNLLVPDEGLTGTTVRLVGEFRELSVVDEPDGSVLAIVGAGLLNVVLLQRLDRLGLGGLGCLAGVPGTVGGAVAMNAGTVLGEVAARLRWVEGLDGTRLARSELPMEYRHGGLPPGFIVLRAAFSLHRDAVADEQARVAHHLARRKATQPLDLPSCGSVFRNPPGDHAGRLLEAAGLKGWSSGAASISERHANFIVNRGGATATDVMRCIRTAWDGALAAGGVRLVPEVHVLGRWDPNLWPLPGVGNDVTLG